MDNYRFYSDSQLKAKIGHEKTIIFIINSRRAFEVPTAKLPQEWLIKSTIYSPKIGMKASIVFLYCTFLLLISNILYTAFSDTHADSFIFMLIFVPYIIFSIFLHEGAHILALKYFGLNIDKIGFKMHYYILPAFYVRMNQSVLLAKSEKILVHGIGISVNLFFNLVLIVINQFFLHSPTLGLALDFTIVTLCANALPVLNSDGYRVLLALTNSDEYKNKKKNKKWIRFIKILSWVLVSLYGISLTFSAIGVK